MTSFMLLKSVILVISKISNSVSWNKKNIYLSVKLQFFANKFKLMPMINMCVIITETLILRIIHSDLLVS